MFNVHKRRLVTHLRSLLRQVLNTRGKAKVGQDRVSLQPARRRADNHAACA